MSNDETGDEDGSKASSGSIKDDVQDALEDSGFDVDPDAPAHRSVEVDHEEVDFVEQSIELVEEVEPGFEGAKEIELELRYKDARYQLAVQRREVDEDG